MCEFCTKIPAFYRRLWLAAPLFRSYFADIQGEKIFSQISSLRKLRSISKIGVDSFVYFTVDEQRKGKKTEWNVSLSCTFLLELFCLLFKSGILLKFIHFLQLYIQNKKLTLFVIPGLPNILTLIIVLYVFKNILRFFFVILRCVVAWIIERLDRKLMSQGLISYRHRRLVVSCSKMALVGFIIVKILCDETMAKMWGKLVEK